MWEPIPFAGVAGNAGANDILPCRLSSTVTWQHVIDIQIVTLEEFPAVLACVLITLKDVEAREFHFFLRQSVEEAKNNDAGNTDLE